MRWWLYLHISIYLSWFFQLSSPYCFLCFLFSPDQAGSSYLLEPVLLSLHQARPHYLGQTETQNPNAVGVIKQSHLPCLAGRKLMTKIQKWQKSHQISRRGTSYSLTHLIKLEDTRFSAYYKTKELIKTPKSLKCTTIDLRGFLKTANQGTGSGSGDPCVPTQMWLRDQQGAGMKPGSFSPLAT